MGMGQQNGVGAQTAMGENALYPLLGGGTVVHNAVGYCGFQTRRPGEGPHGKGR